jgi:hypothetical protein
MTHGTQVLRALAAVALWIGFAFGRARYWLQSLATQIPPTRGWRVIEAGDIQLHVPPGWGDVEPDPTGGLVIHNRARRFRVDGDAVWYASAIELRIWPAGSALPRSAEAMTTYRKTIGNDNARVLIELAIANGVGPAQRQIAQRVLKSAKLRQMEISGPRLAKGHFPPVTAPHGSANDTSKP